MRFLLFAANFLSIAALPGAAQRVTLKIVRQHSNASCISGQISINGKIMGYTLERPWQGNLPLISSIPVGTYSAFVRTETKDKWRIELRDVPKRGNIQLHIGNFVADSLGCILIGRNLTDNLCTLTDSQAAFNSFKLEFAKAAGGEPDSEVPVTVIIEGAT
jgi:hypothetical protein